MKSGNRLRVIRAERGVTQLDLATATRINATRIWKIENGYRAAESF
jgi:transcriptional regulator with XRE-family HTH domain